MPSGKDCIRKLNSLTAGKLTYRLWIESKTMSITPGSVVEKLSLTPMKVEKQRQGAISSLAVLFAANKMRYLEIES